MSTYIMYDDVTASLIPSDAKVVGYYVDGRYANFSAVKARCPNAYFVGIAVTANDDARVLDIETGDATNAQAPAWVKRQRNRGVQLPVVYTSASNASSLMSTLSANGVPRSSYLLWSAHYNGNPHTCQSCGYAIGADATQFTSTAQGKSLDESQLTQKFMDAISGGTVTPAKPPSVKQPTPPTPPAGKSRVPDCRGMSPASAKNQLERFGLTPKGTVGVANTCCWETNPAHWSMVDPGSTVAFTNSLPPLLTLGSKQTPWNEALQTALLRAGISIAIDGDYGPITDQAVRYFQYQQKLTVDGLVGTGTWNTLMHVGAISPPSTEWKYPAPAKVNIGQGTATIPVNWSAVSHSGTPAASYTVLILDNAGKTFQTHKGVKGTTLTVTVPRGTYTARVWGEGSPVGSDHTDYKFTV